MGTMAVLLLWIFCIRSVTINVNTSRNTSFLRSALCIYVIAVLPAVCMVDSPCVHDSWCVTVHANFHVSAGNSLIHVNQTNNFFWFRLRAPRLQCESDFFFVWFTFSTKCFLLFLFSSFLSHTSYISRNKGDSIIKSKCNSTAIERSLGFISYAIQYQFQRSRDTVRQCK